MTTPTCPRCGYDQSGEIARWNNECPVEGTCPECGLELEWSNVLRPNLHPPRWSFEHTPSRGNALRTLARNTRLFRFFTQIRLETPAHRRRIWAYAATTLAFLYAVWITAYAATSYLQIVQQATMARYYFPPSGKLAYSPWVSKGSWRGVPALWFPPISTVDAHVLWAGAMVGRAAWPFSDTLSQTIVGPEFALALRHGGANAPIAPFPTLVAALTPLSLLVLRQTRRRLRIRNDHLLRVWAYALPPVGALSVACTALAQAAQVIWLHYGYSLTISQPWIDRLDRYGPLLPLLPVAWFAVYWFVAIRTYLRLPHAPAVWILTLILGFLVTVLVFGATVALWATIFM